MTDNALYEKCTGCGHLFVVDEWRYVRGGNVAPLVVLCGKCREAELAATDTDKPSQP